MSNDKSAVVNGNFVNASFKSSVELCNYLRGKNLDKAIKTLKGVEEEKIPVPVRKYNWNTPHRKGIAAGKYPVNASKALRALLEGAGKNAENKGLNRGKLIIKVLEANRSMSARKATRYGRGKLTSFRIVVEEE